MSFFDDILNKAKGFLDGFKNSAPMNDRESKEEKKVSKENNVPKATPAAPKKTLKERLFEEQDKIGKIKDCPHGKCYSDGCNFFHTCDITVSCSEKKKNGRYEDLFLPDLEKYIGYFCYWINNNDLSIDNKYFTTSNKAKACIEIFLDYLINTLAPGKEFLKETFYDAIKFGGVKNCNMINMLATVGKADVDESVLSNIHYLLEALKDKNQGLDTTYPFWGIVRQKSMLLFLSQACMKEIIRISNTQLRHFLHFWIPPRPLNLHRIHLMWLYLVYMMKTGE